MVENKTKPIILPPEPSTYPFITIPTLPNPAHLRPSPSTSNVTQVTHCSLPIIESTNTNARPATHMHKRKRVLEELLDELGKLINEDVSLFLKKGWKGLVEHRRPKDDFAKLDISHPARQLLRQYKHTGVPVVTKDVP